MEHNRDYTAPMLTVVEVKPERGYAGSDPLELRNSLMGLEFNTMNVETWDVGDDLFDGGDWD